MLNLFVFLRASTVRSLTFSAVVVATLMMAAPRRVSAAPPHAFDIPRGPAATTLRSFSEQSGEQFIFSAPKVTDVTTNAIHGTMAPSEALDQMLAGTELRGVRDTETGALTVARTTGTLTAPAPIRSANATAATSDETLKLDEFVVTGVFNGVSKQQATVAISTVNAEQIRTQVPLSAADLLKNVPGVFVNSSLGEIRNMVYSRGVSANSADGATGYYYVSLQEDGLPVTNVTYTNFGPDYFYRPDATLDRLEAVRGGSSSITGGNAPGGIFNYLSKTGSSVFGGEVRVRIGLEGDGENPYRRGDFDVGGPLAAGWVYNLGGFYRRAVGARDPGYDLNRGGQMKLSLLKDYGSGSIRIYAKYLDDHNGWFEFLPAKNFNDPQLAPGVKQSWTSILPKASTRAPFGGPDQLRTFNSDDLVHARQSVIGAEWQHSFGDGWRVNNNAKLSDSKANWNTSAIVFAMSVTNPNTYTITGLNAVAGGNAGVYTFKDLSNGQTLASVQSSGGTYTVLSSSLPGRDALADAGYTNASSVVDRQVKEFMDQFSLTKKLGSMSFTGGFFFAHSDIEDDTGNAGRTFATLTERPRLMSVTLTRPNGTVLQLTSPEGFAAQGNRYDLRSATQKDLAAFFGHTWTLSDRFTFDWGMRGGRMETDAVNTLGRPNTQAGDVSFGGVDGNPLTVYDQRYNIRGLTDLHTERQVNTFSISGALNMKIDKENSLYARVSSAQKAPDFDFYYGIDTAFKAASQPAIPQKVKQLEVGFRHKTGTTSFTVTPFYSRLSDINTPTAATNPDSSIYFAPIQLNELETYGVEFEGNHSFTENFSLRAAITWQHARTKKWNVWVLNAPGPADDTLTSYSGTKADNNPQWMGTLTPSYDMGRFHSYLAWKYMGERPANIPNAFTLPAFSQFDLGLGYDLTRDISVNFNVNNLTNDDGVMSWAAPGGFPASLDRQGFTRVSDPNATFFIVTIPPRAYYLTLTYRF